MWTKVYVLLMVFWSRGDEGEGMKREIGMAKGLGACKGIAVAISFVVYCGRALRHWGGTKPLYCQEDESLAEQRHVDGRFENLTNAEMQTTNHSAVFLLPSGLHTGKRAENFAAMASVHFKVGKVS